MFSITTKRMELNILSERHTASLRILHLHLERLLMAPNISCFYLGGAAALTLAALYWIIDVRKAGGFLWRPFMFFGMNAITMYVMFVNLCG